MPLVSLTFHAISWIVIRHLVYFRPSTMGSRALLSDTQSGLGKLQLLHRRVDSHDPDLASRTLERRQTTSYHILRT